MITILYRMSSCTCLNSHSEAIRWFAISAYNVFDCEVSNLIYLYSLDNFEGVWHAPPSFLQSDMWLKGSFLYLSHALNFMPLSSFDYGLILWQMSKTFKKILQKAKSISFNLLVITKVFFSICFHRCFIRWKKVIFTKIFHWFHYEKKNTFYRGVENGSHSQIYYLWQYLWPESFLIIWMNISLNIYYKIIW